MPNSPAILAVIPARAGSKRLRGKNMRELAGQPLVVHTILAAKGVAMPMDIVVSTDDPAVAACASEHDIRTIRRPAALAEDNSTSAEVVLHVLMESEIAYDIVILLQPTSPLRTSIHINECLSQFLSGDFSSAISVCTPEHHPAKSFQLRDGLLQPFVDKASLHASDQSLPLAYEQNGAIYIVRREVFEREKTFFLPPCMPYVMGRVASLDVNDEDDLYLAEHTFRPRL